MIVSRSTVERVSTLEGQKIAMSIDLSAEAVASMMRSMIDLYEDQELACIREYSTNAWDAHIQASIAEGGTATHYRDGTRLRAIEVELPGQLSPFLTIRDYGVGLSAQDIVEVYSKYGASTKRDSNEVQGMLGYGCKAALSYTPQFTVTSVKDGVRAQIAVSREGDGGGSMQIVDESATTEGNGTTITIPIRRDNEVERKARLFFSFWEPGTVLLNGKAPEQIQGLPIGRNITVIEAPKDTYGDRMHAKSYVVMGKVAYPARFPGVELARGYGLVCRVDIGDVNFGTSREGLMDKDPDTLATIQRLERQFHSDAPAAIQTQIDKCSTPYEALDTMVRYRAMLKGARKTNYTFKGSVLPAVYDFRGDGQTMVATRRSSALGSAQRVWELDAAAWTTTLWMENHTGEKFSASHKRKILQWCASNGKDDLQNFVYLAAGLSADVKRYVDPTNVIDWQLIKDEKLPTNTVSGGHYTGYKTKAITGSFEVWVDGDWKGEYAASAIDNSKPIYYRHGNRQENRRMANLMASITPACTFVCVPGNRLAKFQRDFPAAVEADKAGQDAFEAWKKSIGSDMLLALAIEDTGQRGFFASLDMLKVKDPDIKRAIRLSLISLTSTEERRKLFFYALRHNSLTLPSFTNPMTKYPLFTSQYGRYSKPDKRALDHFYLYINAAYDAAKKGA
jgi:hypothetical protein